MKKEKENVKEMYRGFAYDVDYRNLKLSSI